MVARIVSSSPGPDFVDVGTGTGIAARLFAQAGCKVLGVDPDPRMAEAARERGLDVDVARFEEWDAGERRFDAVIAAQAWHWVDNVAGASKAAGVLRGGGRFAAFWNAESAPPELASAFALVYDRVIPESISGRRWSAGPDTAPGYTQMCETATEGLRRSGGFSEPELWRFEWDHDYTRDEWLDQVPTQGDHGRSPARHMDELVAALGIALDAGGGSFTMHYATLVATALRIR